MQFKLPFTTVVLAAVLTCVGCAAPAPDSAPPGAKQASEQTVISDEGPFQFSEVAISRDYSGANVTARVTNNTPKLWRSAAFEITVFDDAGRRIGSNIFSFTNFAPGQTQPIASVHQPLRLTDDRKISSFDFKFMKGVFQAKYVFSMTKPTAAADMAFSDGLIDVRFEPAEKQIGFVIRNKGSSPAKIDWNSAAFVDIAGTSHKVMHDGVKLIDRGNMQPPTVIPPGASIRDFVYPTDYAVYAPGRYGGWTELPMFPEAPLARGFKGQSFSVFLPIEVDGKVKNYNFVFLINDVVS